MSALVFDIETDGLYWESTVVHVISIMTVGAPVSSLESFSDTPLPGVVGTIEEALQRLTEASTLICHNEIFYDLPVLKKICGWGPSEHTKIFDTLVVSRLLNPDRPKPANYTGKGGPHSLEAWGYRTGTSKPGHEDWSVFSPDMLRRNRKDVEINHSVYYLLKSEIGTWDWQEAIDLEHDVARILAQQEINGVNFDVELAKQLVIELTCRVEHIDSELLPGLPCSYKPWGVSVNQPFKTTGGYKKMVTDWYSDIEDHSCIPVHGPFTRLSTIVMNLGSMPQVKAYLLTQGWIPTKWNYNDDGERSSPQLTEDSYGTISGNMGELIKSRLLCSHRRAQIQGWIERIRADGRLTAGINPCGTNTGRARHHDVVNVPKAKAYVFLGIEMRSLFIAAEGKVLVGHDAKGLELRMLAHYINDPEFTKAVTEGDEKDGTDIHTLNQKLAGLPTRDAAKTFIYAFLYGAGNEKLGSIVGGSEKDGAEIRKRFLDGLPALKKLIERVKRASQKGYLKGLDGRKIWMRTSNGQAMTHKALNTLLQSAGAIVMKRSMLTLDQSIQSQGIPSLKVLDMHDEAQAEMPLKYVPKYTELAIDSVVQSGIHFKLNTPLDASASFGKNWSETH